MNANELLRIQFEKRKEVNPRFSLRAFARSLNLSPGFLSQVLNGTKRVSDNLLFELCEQFGIDQADITAKTRMDISTYADINHWLHFGLYEISMFEPLKNPKSLAKRFGVEVSEVEQAITALTQLGMIDSEGTRTRKGIYTTPIWNQSETRKVHHKRNISKAVESLENDDLSDCEISSLTLAMDPKLMEEFRTEVRKMYSHFSRRAIEHAKMHPHVRNEAYQMNVQLFSLTKRVDA